MKKLLAIMLCIFLAVSAVACTGGQAPAAEPEAPAAEEPAAEEPAAEEPAAEEPVEMVKIENVLYTQFGYYFFTHATGKDVINACIASEPETIDPGLISSVDGSTYTQHQFEPLMKYVSTGEPVVAEDPSVLNTKIDFGMAESYEATNNDDGTVTYIFKLRDAKWSDGKAVTAADFEYAWKRIVDPTLASDYGYILDGIVVNAAQIQAGEATPDTLGIKAIDEKTLQIDLVVACPYFVELCAFASLMPLRQDIIELNGDAWTDPANIVVNGPYKVTEWVHDSFIKMEKNAEYYDAANVTGPKEIIWNLSDSETAILSSYESGEYDFIENFPTDRIADLQASGDCFILPYVGTYYLYICCEEIVDWRVRAAITLVTDRENIVKNVTQAGQVPATGIVASGIKDSEGRNFAEVNAEGCPTMWKWLQENYADKLDLDLNFYEDCCELANVLVDEAVADGFDKGMTIYYRFNTSETHQAIAEAVQSDVNGVLGLSMELSNQDWNVYTDGLAEGDFGLARLGWIADYNDPITYLELFTNGNSYNYGRWVSDEYTGLINQAKLLPAGAERDALLYQAEGVLFGENGFTVNPLYFYTNMYCMH